MFRYPFPHWDIVAWLVVLAAAFALEFFGIFRPGMATLTRLICNTIPAWARWMVLGWLIYHFGIQNR